MKDMYTFDATPSSALETYNTVRQAYSDFFNEFGIPWMMAQAASGEMGGTLSHECHFPSSKGEDRVLHCSHCDYCANEETILASNIERGAAYPDQRQGAEGLEQRPDSFESNAQSLSSWFGLSHDRKTLVQAIYPVTSRNNIEDGKSVRNTRPNLQMIKSVFPFLDLGVERPLETFTRLWDSHQGETNERPLSTPLRLHQLFDCRVNPSLYQKVENPLRTLGRLVEVHQYPDQNHNASIAQGSSKLDIIMLETGDKCPACAIGSLTITSAIEIGHTFFLGTRYSKPLEATFASKDETKQVPFEMGCYGIGVSRLIAAVADSVCDVKGLNWPRVMAPFEVVVVASRGLEADAQSVWDLLAAPRLVGHADGPDFEVATNARAERTKIDVVIDDRDKDLAWKLNDADLIGYPIIVVLGKAWRREKKCEVQCRRMGSLRQDVPEENLQDFVEGLLKTL